jgi:eukaryotic-like serine/threonine-protein kinase
MIGQRLGSFTIQSLLGAGGMGEVYRARDSRLDREVAIKILPAVWLADPDRRTRFEREARLLAALNHPNVGAIYGVEDVDGGRALVLELVEGPTLAERLERGPLPFKETLTIAAQIADALDAAHQSGIVHRDLKPANIKIRNDGRVKVLDFGLAKIARDESTPDVSVAATATFATRHGAVLGTAAYMSPEQARGMPVDKRTDIWAFGCILYEMLTGRPAFARATFSDTIAATLEHEPDWQSLPVTTPAAIRRLVKRCLEKDVARRLRDIGDVALDLNDTRSDDGIAGSPGVTRSSLPWFAAAAIATVAASVAGGAVWMFERTPPAPVQVTRLAVSLPAGDTLGNTQIPSIALAPDGRTMAYAASRGGRSPQLFVRRLDAPEATLLPGTDGARGPFFSPNGQWIGFFAQGKLKKVLAAGGGLQSLADAAVGLGGSWSGDDTIYFAPFNTSSIWKVSANGGTPQEFTRVDKSRDEVSHRWPQVLADRKTLLFTVWTGPGWDEKHLEIQVGEGGAHRRLVPGASTGRYISTGHLLYSKADNLIVAPFDLASLSVTGPPVTLVERARDGVGEGAQYSVSDSGTLAYVQAQAGVFERRLVWVSRDGTVTAIAAPPNAYTDPAISPDGRSVALSVQGTTQTLWVYDLVRSSLTTLPEPGSLQSPLWTPDGRRLAYRATRAGYRNLFWRPADGSGQEERLTTSAGLHTPSSFSRDGRILLFTDIAADTGNDIWVMDIDARQRSARAVLKTRSGEFSPKISPDGKWLAYSSDESGRLEIYVSQFPAPGGKITISTDGGAEPRWSRDGRELFYRQDDKMMAVTITPGPSLTASSPRMLFEGRYQLADTGIGGYDVAPDGRFLMIQATVAEQPAAEFNIVLGWFDDVKARIARP